MMRCLLSLPKANARVVSFLTFDLNTLATTLTHQGHNRLAHAVPCKACLDVLPSYALTLEPCGNMTSMGGGCLHPHMDLVACAHTHNPQHMRRPLNTHCLGQCAASVRLCIPPHRAHVAGMLKLHQRQLAASCRMHKQCAHHAHHSHAPT